MGQQREVQTAIDQTTHPSNSRFAGLHRPLDMVTWCQQLTMLSLSGCHLGRYIGLCMVAMHCEVSPENERFSHTRLQTMLTMSTMLNLGKNG